MRIGGLVFVLLFPVNLLAKPVGVEVAPRELARFNSAVSASGSFRIKVEDLSVTDSSISLDSVVEFEAKGKAPGGRALVLGRLRATAKSYGSPPFSFGGGVVTNDLVGKRDIEGMPLPRSAVLDVGVFGELDVTDEKSGKVTADLAAAVLVSGSSAYVVIPGRDWEGNEQRLPAGTSAPLVLRFADVGLGDPTGHPGQVVEIGGAGGASAIERLAGGRLELRAVDRGSSGDLLESIHAQLLLPEQTYLIRALALDGSRAGGVEVDARGEHRLSVWGRCDVLDEKGAVLKRAAPVRIWVTADSVAHVEVDGLFHAVYREADVKL